MHFESRISYFLKGHVLVFLQRHGLAESIEVSRGRGRSRLRLFVPFRQGSRFRSGPRRWVSLRFFLKKKIVKSACTKNNPPSEAMFFLQARIRKEANRQPFWVQKCSKMTGYFDSILLFISMTVPLATICLRADRYNIKILIFYFTFSAVNLRKSRYFCFSKNERSRRHAFLPVSGCV